MVSAQIAGTYTIDVRAPSGATKQIKQATAYFWGPGGSSEGAIANTPEKWNALPVSSVVGGSGYEIVISLTAAAAKTADASDGIGVIPIIVNGQPQTIGLNGGGGGGLGNENFTSVLAAGDNAYVADVKTPVAIIRAKEGVSFRIGGGRVFLSIEDNV